MILCLAVSVEHQLVTDRQTDARQQLIPALATVARVKTTTVYLARQISILTFSDSNIGKNYIKTAAVYKLFRDNKITFGVLTAPRVLTLSSR